MKKKDIKQHIQENRYSYDQEETDFEGLWQKIDKQTEPGSGNNSRSRKGFWIAAAIMAIIGAAVFFKYHSTSAPHKIKTADKNKSEENINSRCGDKILPEEIKEARFYYTAQVQQKISRIHDKQVLKEVKSELHDLSQEECRIINEMKGDVNELILKEALIRNYRNKVKLVDNVLTQEKG